MIERLTELFYPNCGLICLRPQYCYWVDLSIGLIIIVCLWFGLKFIFGGLPKKAGGKDES